MGDKIKYFVVSVVILISFTANGECVEKYNWKASESAPENYLMEIVKGDFIDSSNKSLYIPNGKTLDQGWGLAVSSHVVGDDVKLLPNKLKITFFSYNENKFYFGDFDLPYDKILSEFNNGYFSPKLNKHITYDTIVAGVSPGGGVAVWLSGIDKRKEVFFGTANEIKGDWTWIIDNPTITREEFIQSNILDKLDKESITLIKRHGIPTKRWKQYHDLRYQWVPVFTGISLRNDWIQNIKYYNGEEGYLNYPLDKNEKEQTRGVPSEIHFVWKYKNDQNFNYEIYFDEAEVFDSFKKLSEKSGLIELEMKLFFEGTQGKFDVSLKNGNKTIHLKKIRLKTYGAN